MSLLQQFLPSSTAAQVSGPFLRFSALVAMAQWLEISSTLLQGDLQFPLKHGHSSHYMRNHSGSIQRHDVLLIRERYWKKDVRKEGKRRNCQRHMCIWKEQGRKVETWICSSQKLTVLASCIQKCKQNAGGYNKPCMWAHTHTHAEECFKGSEVFPGPLFQRLLKKSGLL